MKYAKYTIDNGGCTIDNNTSEIVQLKKGYVVAIKQNERIIELPTKLDILNLNNIIEGYSKYYSNTDYIGTWLNENKLYLDTVHIFTNKQKAINFAKDNKQIAIYDLANDKEIFL